MLKKLRLSAIVPSTNIQATKQFLIDILQFEDVPMMQETPDYAIVRTADTELHLQTSQGEPNQMSLYLLVESAGAFWDALKEKQGELKVKPPFDQEYGMREVHLILPHTNTLVFIGEDIG